VKRSEINLLIAAASKCFSAHGWALPPAPRWDVTDFGLGDYKQYGLVLINLAEQPEYCEKLMYVQRGMVTPAHTHRKKKEDIIARWGELSVQVWSGHPQKTTVGEFSVLINGAPRSVKSGEVVKLPAGQRITLVPGTYHEFYTTDEEMIIGEVSTANDDTNDNIFVNPEIGRYSAIEEDAPIGIRLLNEKI
jgi:D-lyxose ketol-isomerase